MLNVYSLCVLRGGCGHMSRCETRCCVFSKSEQLVRQGGNPFSVPWVVTREKKAEKQIKRTATAACQQMQPWSAACTCETPHLRS